MPDHLPAIRTLLSQDDAESVRQGIALLQSLADPALWALYARDVELEVGLDIVVGSEIETHVASGFRADVAFWALRETGQLDGKTQLRLSECRLLTDLRPLIGLNALESLDLSDCPSVTSVDGIEYLRTLRALDLSNSSAVDLAPLRQLPHLTSLRLANRKSLTTLAALDGLTCLESLDVSGCSSLTSLDGLDRFPALREVRLDGCNGLKSLAGLPPTVRIARTPSEYEDAFPVRHGHHALWMSETEGQLRLNGLTSVSQPEAEALVAAAGTLTLDGLRAVSDEVATILARQGGRLSLDGIRTLSTKAAAALATMHTGDLMLRDLEAPTDADVIFIAHAGRVSLGSAFQHIDVGRFDASQDIETYGERVDATLLTFPIEEERTFTLKHQIAWPSEVKAGILDDTTVSNLLAEDADPLDWWDYDNIASAYGVTEPATTLILPDGTEQEVSLRYWPRSCHRMRQVQRHSERGDFVHITTSAEKGTWHAYSVTLPEGVFDLARVRVSWEGEFVDGYTYVHEDGTIDVFESDDEVETRGKGVDSFILFNTGSELIHLDLEELREDLEEAGLDPQDIDGVRAFLLQRADSEAASEEDDRATETDEGSDSPEDDAAEDAQETAELDRNPFEVACGDGDVVAVEAMLRAGYDVNAIGLMETPPLFVAVSEGTVEVVRVLLDAGANVNCQDVWAGHTPLQYALQREEVDARLIDLMLARGGTLSPDEEQTLLEAIAATGRMDLVEVAVARGADLLADGHAAAQEAARREHWQLANELAQRIASAGGDTILEVTPEVMGWLEAAAAGDTDSLDRLHGRVDLNGTDVAGQTALHLAVAGGHIDAVRQLLEWGANPNQRDARGEAPINRIHFASLWDIEAMVTVLLEYDADPTVADADGRTPASHAFAHPSLMKRLLGAGADGRAANRWGQTPLHWCASIYIPDEDEASRRLLVAEILLAQDVGLSGVRDTEGRTALDDFVEQDARERISTDTYDRLFRLFAGAATPEPARTPKAEPDVRVQIEG